MESNHRHKDFQSFALPTELHHRLGIANVGIKFTYTIVNADNLK